jgi:hypothetical protein
MILGLVVRLLQTPDARNRHPHDGAASSKRQSERTNKYCYGILNDVHF